MQIARMGADALLCCEAEGPVSKFMRVHRKARLLGAQGAAAEKKTSCTAKCRTPESERRFFTPVKSYGLVVLSTLLPMIPPRIAPAAPPMIAPFTLFLLVTAPITAPAPAPMAASRFVCFTTVGCGAGAL